MKRILLTLLVTMAGTGFMAAQELITDGNMENAAAWTSFWRGDAPDTGMITFNYLDDFPSGGAGGCLSLASFGQTGVHAYQAVTITPGNYYKLTSAFKTSGLDDVADSWVEVILSSTQPPADSDFQGDNGDYIYAQNVWMDPPYNSFGTAGFDGTIEDDFEFRWASGSTDASDSTLNAAIPFLIPDTTSITTWYVVLKAGRWSTAGDVAASFNLLFDEISLMDMGNTPPSSLENISGTNELSEIFPNPSTGMINVHLLEERKASYTIYNAIGMLVKSGSLDGSGALYLNGLSKGAYQIAINFGENTEMHRLILK